jgi:hypothetical protein
MKWPRHIRFGIAVLAGFFAGLNAQGATALFDQTAMLYSTNYQRGVNWQSKGGLPRPGSGGTPTPNQFRGGIVYGAVTYQQAANLDQSRSFPANARHLNWPHTENADGTVKFVLRSQAGAPYMMRSISFFFGAVVAPPQTKENGTPLTAAELANYWAPEPATTNNHAGSGYYWSPHATKVYAIQPGRIDITWRRSAAEPAAPTSNLGSYTNIGGLYFRLLSTNYLVSGAVAKTPRKIFWTEKTFQGIGKPIRVPAGRVGAVNIVYQEEFPERVTDEYTALGQSEIVAGSTNRLQELRTLWFDRSDSQIHAYNKEGRVFVELLGDVRSGTTRNQLGYEIVDVIRQASPTDVTIELGEKLTPGGTLTNLFPEPVLSGAKNYAFQHGPPGGDTFTLYAIRETKNLNDYQVYWMEEGAAGLRWPAVLARYALVWPADPAKYSHYVRPSADQQTAQQTAVPLPTDNVPVIEWQDVDALNQPRAFLTGDFKFYSYLDSALPAHRTLLRFSSGDNVAFERVFSVLESVIKTPGFDGTRERAFNPSRLGSLGGIGALDLNPALGKAYGQLPPGVYFDGGSFTVESWVYVRSHQSLARLFDFSAAPLTDVVALSLATAEDDRPAFVTLSNTFGINVVAPHPLPLNQWVHLAVVFQAGTGAGTGTGTIYFNGTNQISRSGMILPRAVTRVNAYVGKSNLPRDPSPDALFDNFRIWSEARTPQQLAEGMQANYPDGTPNLQAQYQFSEDPGTTGGGSTVALDSSGHGRTMTLFNTSILPNKLTRPRFVETTAWVGQRLAPPGGESASATGLAYLAGAVNQTYGTSYSATAYQDPFKVGLQAAANGSIIPVNASNNTARLEVWWYRKDDLDLAKGFKPIYWPSVIARYSIQWPTNTPFSREIILASNDGSGALTSLEAKGAIYTQNDPAKPGYNPNEEHALLLGGHAYALRDDLNVTTGPGYSSHPYVLLEYADSDGRPSMSVFQVFREKGAVVFDYAMQAGLPLQAPMPLPAMELPLPQGVTDLSANLNTEVTGRLIQENSASASNETNSVTLKTTLGHQFRDSTVYTLQQDNSQTNLVYFFSGDGVGFPNELYGLVSSNRPAQLTFNTTNAALFAGRPNRPGFDVIPPEDMLAVGDPSKEGDQLRRVRFTADRTNGLAASDVVWLTKLNQPPDKGRIQLTVSSVGLVAGRTNQYFVTFEITDQIAALLNVTKRREFYTYAPPNNGARYERGYDRYDLSGFAGYNLLVKPKTDLANDLRDRRILSEVLAPGVSPVSTTPRDLLYSKVLLKDRKGTFWIYRGPHGANDSAQFQVQWFYKTIEGFYFPNLPVQPGVGVLAPYLRQRDASGQPIGPRFAGDPGFAGANAATNLHPLSVTYHAQWPDNVPVLTLGETLTTPKHGLPAVRGNTSAEIVYEQSQAQSNRLESAMLFDPTREKVYALGAVGGLQKIPASIRTSVFQGKTYFPNLPPHLQKRFFFDPNASTNGALVLIGQFVDDPVGEKYLLLNVLGAGTDGTSDLELVKALPVLGDPDRGAWQNAIDALTARVELFQEDPTKPGTFAVASFTNYAAGQVAEIRQSDEAVDSYALSAAGPGAGFVSLILGNGRAFTPPDEPVAVQIVRVAPPLYRGEVKVLPADNPLSELVSFQHTADLSGKFAEFEYEWRIAPPTDGQPLPVSTTLGADPGPGWLPARNGSGTGKPRFILGGTGIETLADNYIIMRYRPKNPSHPLYNQWSMWTEPQLAEGWIKRVLAGINPFNQRVTDLFNNRVNTDVSILTQAGPRWEGDVALNLEAVNHAGLIEVYETVLRRGKNLSINAGINYGPANDALLLAAGYLSDLYMMLGNEAWADAANPTISIGTKDKTYGDIATALFSFKGQMPSLLEEELAMLRGRDDFLVPGVNTAPVYNRLYWNYTRGIDAGEVIYALNYNIQKSDDTPPGAAITADDARIMFPQGHGDAYGHYLTAIKGYLSLLLNTDFDWVPRVEAVTVLGKPVTVNYQDERKFAAAAAAVARTGRQIFDLTWRRDFVPGDDAGWSHFSTNRINTNRPTPVPRDWGLDHWASRTGQGAYLNWAMGNAILPDVDPDPAHEGIQKVDRTTVPELQELPATANDLQTAMDNAEAHLTPVGLASGSLAFDIDPTQVTGPNVQTHFEQVYARAKATLNNALAAFDDAKDVTRIMRSEQDSLADLQASIAKQELAYTNLLIEVYGTPYPDDVGPGKTYVQGYTGPDTLHFAYVDTPELTFPGLVEPSQQAQFNIAYDFKGKSPILNSTNVSFTLDSHGFYAKPTFWKSKRPSPGKIQAAISDIILARNAALSALALNQQHQDNITQLLKMYGAKLDLDNTLHKWDEEKAIILDTIDTVKFAAEMFELGEKTFGEAIEETTKATLTAIPESTIIGLANGGDILSGARAAILAVAAAEKVARSGTAFAKAFAVGAAEVAQEAVIRTTEAFQIGPAERRIENAQIEYDGWQDELAKLQRELFTINQRIQELDAASMRYSELVARGDRVLQEREIFRQRSAALIQGFRTRDAAFRIFRNEKLERYKTLFELAARYAFLAANAYDYETGLLHTAQGKEFINRIVKSRALGVMRNGEPQFAGSDTGDPGLSSALAEMKTDFDVLKGRLGFNNPNSYGTTVSLRMEKERIIPSADGLATWQDVLQRGRRANLLDDDDIKRNCMQIDRGNGLPVPGIVIEFSTSIEDGLNLFGRDLAGGDHYFDTSLFATKIFGVGVAFEGYVGMDNPVANTAAVNTAGGVSPPDPSTTFLGSLSLAATPGIYLIPVGVDSMRSPPLGDVSEIRSWNVSDVAIPLPFNIGGSDFSTKALWQSNQSLSEPLFAVRKHQAFRPVSTTAAFGNEVYSSNGSLRLSQYTNNRLIGRSAWNTKWKLVIPGHKLLSDPLEGLDRFVQTVKDIKLHFVTYSYAGN